MAFNGYRSQKPNNLKVKMPKSGIKKDPLGTKKIWDNGLPTTSGNVYGYVTD